MTPWHCSQLDSEKHGSLCSIPILLVTSSNRLNPCHTVFLPQETASHHAEANSPCSVSSSLGGMSKPSVSHPQNPLTALQWPSSPGAANASIRMVLLYINLFPVLEREDPSFRKLSRKDGRSLPSRGGTSPQTSGLGEQLL